ncbi:MAG: ABC transporter ATP-binding protein [Rhodospirillales bacterium]
MNKQLKLLFRILTPRQKATLAILLFSLLGAAVLESLGIGLILPFLRLVTDPSALDKVPWLAAVYKLSGASSYNEFLFFATGGLVAVFLLKNSYLAYVSYFQIRFSQNIFQCVAQRLLKAFCNRPYTYHLTHNSSEIIRVITSDAHAISNTLLRPGLTLITECVVVIAITTTLIIIDPFMTSLAFGIIGVTMGIFYFCVRPGLRRLGIASQTGSGGMIHWINQCLGAIREIKISGRRRLFFDAFADKVRIYADSAIVSNILQMLPRLLLETLAVAGLAGAFVVSIWQGKSGAELLPILATFAVAAFRLMPSANRILISASQFHLGGAFLEAVVRGLEEELHNTSASQADQQTTLPIKFEKAMELRNISFSYPESKINALHDISVTLKRGESLGIVGPSGGGKSTLLNIILGLLTPSEGEFRVDGHDVLADPTAWQRCIGFVPQDIYLLDETIRANVAFGFSPQDMDETRLFNAVSAAHLNETVNNFPEGIDTVVGERGVRLSGGQRQRVAMARALYNEPAVIIMDEATASLDNESEQEIAQAIARLKGARTFIIVAHRLSTVQGCDRLVFLKDGKIAATGTYDELAGGNADFQRMARIA